MLLFETKGGFVVFNAHSSRMWMNKLNTSVHWWNEQTCTNVFLSRNKKSRRWWNHRQFCDPLKKTSGKQSFVKLHLKVL